jgi:hypothetical protein
MPEFGAATSKSQRSVGALFLSQTSGELVPVAINKSYFLEMNAQDAIPAGADHFAGRGRSPEPSGTARQKFSTLVDDSPAQLFQIRKRFRMAAARPVA